MPPNNVQQAYQQIKVEFEQFNYRSKLLGFFKYFENTWLNSESLFPISIWNHFENNGPRTNNHSEGFNNKLTRDLPFHPSIWKYIEIIKQVEEELVIKYLHLKEGTINVRKIRLIDIKRDNLIEKLKSKLTNSEFLKSAQLMA